MAQACSLHLFSLFICFFPKFLFPFLSVLFFLSCYSLFPTSIHNKLASAIEKKQRWKTYVTKSNLLHQWTIWLTWTSYTCYCLVMFISTYKLCCTLAIGYQTSWITLTLYIPICSLNKKGMHTICTALTLDVMSLPVDCTMKRSRSIWNRGKTCTFYGYSQWSMQSTGSDIKSNLEAVQTVHVPFSPNTYNDITWKQHFCHVYVIYCAGNDQCQDMLVTHTQKKTLILRDAAPEFCVKSRIHCKWTNMFWYSKR